LKRHWSIRTHLIALVLAIVIPLAGLEIFAIYSENRRSQEQAEAGLLGLAQVTSATVAQFLDDGQTLLLELVERPEVRSMSGTQCDPLLEDLNDFFPQYTNLFVTDLEAGLVCSGLPAGPDIPELPLDTEWFQEVTTTMDFAVGKPHRGLLSGIWNVVMAHPVRSLEGEMIGVAAISVDLIRFQEILTNPVLPGGTVITIDDLDGTVVARSEESELWVGRTLPTSGLGPEILEGAGGVTRAMGAEGDDRVWGFTAVPGAPWRVWAGVPVAAVYGPVQETAAQRISLALILLSLVGILAILMYRRIANSLIRLMWESRQAAEDGGGAISLQGPEEVVAVAGEFNRTLQARREAEERHRRSLARYRSVMENAVFGIYAATPEGRFLEVNPALATMLGYDSVHDLLKVPVPSLFRDPEDVQRFRPAKGPGGSLGPLEVEWLQRDGTPLTVRLSGNVIRLGADELVYEVIAEDVTAQRVLEERIRESQKMEAVGRLAGGVAHDFNNLLTVITGSAHLLRSDLPLEDPNREGVEEVLDAASRGASLTRQLLAFSRKQVLQPKVLDLNQVVMEMEAFLGRLVGEKVQLSTDLEPEPWLIRADPGQLEQIIMNLVLNARDATELSGPVEIRTRNVALLQENTLDRLDLPPGRYVRLSVRDRGIGIPREIQGRVFEPFFTTKAEGTGLGLATVYGVVAQSGGKVVLESRPGVGSVFRIYLPVAEEGAS